MPDSTDTAAKEAKSAIKPTAREQYGTISAAYFPREVALADGGRFTAHEISIRRSFKDKDGKWDHRSLSIDRKEAMNLVLALTDVYKATYRLAPPDQQDDV